MRHGTARWILGFLLFWSIGPWVEPAAIAADSREVANTKAVREYFRRVAEKREQASWQHIRSLEDWTSQRDELRRQLFEMLGLWPLPEKSDLKPVVTGKISRYGVTAEKLHFQSRPGLYVTANFYRPEKVDGKLPTIVYLCGHGQVKTDGVSFGNKVHYHHHAVWFAKHGYCCLVIDTLQLGEIEGIHHGTHRLGRWWWVSRGYTPAGVEAWNAIRALDYLATRPEVDMEKLGVTGRSGGGIYSWWLAALDDRPQAIVPVAGITDLENQVVDYCITGHCDCMFMVNHYGWDFPMVTALAAPRSVLFANSDKDTIFPLSGVQRSHHYLATLYSHYKKPGNLGLLITEGPHSDTQELQVPAFRWMNRWLRQTDELLRDPAEKLFTPHELKVFKKIPADEKNTTIDETFVPIAEVPEAPASMADWETLRAEWMGALQRRSLAGWPAEPADPQTEQTFEQETDGIRVRTLEITTDENLRFPVHLVQGVRHEKPELLIVTVVDDVSLPEWQKALGKRFAPFAGSPETEEDAEAFASMQGMLERFPWCFAVVAPRGWGPNRWDSEPRANAHLLRSFVLLGKTADEGRIWDIRRSIAALQEIPDLKESRLWLQGKGAAAGIALYAGIFEPVVERLDLHQLSTTHAQQPILMSVLRTFDMPQALALAFPKKVMLYGAQAETWSWAEKIGALYDSSNPPLEFRGSAAPDAEEASE